MRPGEAITKLLTAERGTYVHAQLANFTGIKNDNLQNWVKRDIVRPAAPAPGRQGRHRYSGRDMAGIYVGSKLIELGLPPALGMQLGYRCVIDFVSGRVNFVTEARKSQFSDDDVEIFHVLFGPFDITGIKMSLVEAKDIYKHLDSKCPSIVLPIGSLIHGLAVRSVMVAEA